MVRSPTITASRVVKIARSHIGVRERGNNRTRFGAAYGYDGVAWCGIHVWAVFREAGVDLRQEGIVAPVSTNAFDADAKRAGWQAVSKYAARPGDIVFYDFGDVDGPGPDTANDDDHVGIVSRRSTGGTLKAIEGNTSSGLRGSQANGDGVYERTRPLSLVRHVYRPPYRALTAELRAREAAVQAAAQAKAVKLAAARKAAVVRAAAAKKAADEKSRRSTKPIAGAVVAVVAVGGGAAVVATQLSDGAGPATPPSAAPTSRPSPSPVPTVTKKPTSKPKPAVVQRRVLRYRKGRGIMHGADVGRVQRLVGMHGNAVDGDYGPATAHRVRAWQRKHHLKPVDGDWGSQATKAAGWLWRP